MKRKLNLLTYRERQFEDALFTCPNRVGLRKGNAAEPSLTVAARAAGDRPTCDGTGPLP